MRTIITLLIATILISGVSMAQEIKPGAVSIGSYVIIWEEDGLSDSFGGLSLGGSYAFSSSMAVRGAAYATEHEDTSMLKINGFEAQFLLGSNLDRVGFRWFGLGGFYKDTFEVEVLGVSASHDFSGLMVGGGLGYNWEKVVLDFSLAWRQADDYKDYVEDVSEAETDVVMSSGSLSIGFRF